MDQRRAEAEVGEGDAEADHEREDRVEPELRRREEPGQGDAARGDHEEARDPLRREDDEAAKGSAAEPECVGRHHRPPCSLT